MIKKILPIAAIGGIAYLLLSRKKEEPVPVFETTAPSGERAPIPASVALEQDIVFSSDPRIQTVLDETLTPEEKAMAATDQSYFNAVVDYAEQQVAARGGTF